MPTDTRDLIAKAMAASAARDREFLRSPFVAAIDGIESRDGAAARAAALRTALGAVLERHQPQVDALNFPESVKALVRREHSRIAASLTRGADEEFDLRHHAMRSDFRLAGFGRFPAGVQHFEVGGVPRSLIWKGGLRQAVQVGRAFLEAGGVTPFYVGHLAHGIKPWAFLLAYNRETQAAWQRNIAECLVMNPHIRGFLASGWFYDPQLSFAAPHLAFLREGSVAHGALLARVGPTEGALKMALARSPERHRLWVEGKYLPTSHAVLWTRQAMIRWAERA